MAYISDNMVGNWKILLIKNLNKKIANIPLHILVNIWEMDTSNIRSRNFGLSEDIKWLKRQDEEEKNILQHNQKSIYIQNIKNGPTKQYKFLKKKKDIQSNSKMGKSFDLFPPKIMPKYPMRI